MVRSVGADNLGVEHVRFQQMHRGVPVTGGEFFVHLRGARVVAANGKLAEKLTVDVIPQIPADEALEEARSLIAKHYPDSASAATYGAPRLEVLDQGLLDGSGHPARLTWFIEAKGWLLREYIWVDAQGSGVVLHFSQLPSALIRRVLHGQLVEHAPRHAGAQRGRSGDRRHRCGRGLHLLG